MDPTPEDVKRFVAGAEAALNREDHRARRDLSGDPVLVATDIATGARLPNLIPKEWKPALTEMIMKAVEREDWKSPPTH
jgi:hypothetical protein